MFRGLNSVHIDAKGRMAIPKRYRDDLRVDDTHQLIVTIDTESPCLLIYPRHQWLIIEEKLQNLPSFQAPARRIQRLLIGHATELELDGNGRVLLPGLLRDYARLSGKSVLVGQGKKFELWDEAVWSEHRDQWIKEASLNPEGMPEEIQTLAL